MNALEQARYLQDEAHLLGVIARGANRVTSSTTVEFQRRSCAMYQAARDAYDRHAGLARSLRSWRDGLVRPDGWIDRVQPWE